MNTTVFPSIEAVKDAMRILLSAKPDYYEQNNQNLVRDAVEELETKSFVFDSDTDKESLITSLEKELGWEEN